MKLHIIIFLLCLVFVNPLICQNSQQAKQKGILKNWAAAQVGELAGWGLTALTLKTLEGMDVIGSNSEEQRDKNYIVTAIAFGHLSGNLLLKRQTGQSNRVFLENLAFSALPVIVYTVLVQPNFEKKFPVEEIQKDIGVVLVSMFVTPIFSAIGNEIFSSQQSRIALRKTTKIQPYVVTLNRNYRMGVSIYF